MTIKPFENEKEIFEFARRLRSAFEEKNCKHEARELSEVTDTFWTTTSEALGEMRVSLKRVRSKVESTFDRDMLAMVDKAIEQIDDAFRLANNPK